MWDRSGIKEGSCVCWDWHCEELVERGGELRVPNGRLRGRVEYAMWVGSCSEMRTHHTTTSVLHYDECITTMGVLLLHDDEYVTPR